MFPRKPCPALYDCLSCFDTICELERSLYWLGNILQNSVSTLLHTEGGDRRAEPGLQLSGLLPGLFTTNSYVVDKKGLCLSFFLSEWSETTAAALRRSKKYKFPMRVLVSIQSWNLLLNFDSLHKARAGPSAFNGAPGSRELPTRYWGSAAAWILSTSSMEEKQWFPKIPFLETQSLYKYLCSSVTNLKN